MDKQELREKLKTKRMKLSAEQVQQKSAKITAQAIRYIDWKNIATVHCFTTMPELNEVDTQRLFEYIWEKHSHISTYTAIKVGLSWRTGKVAKGMFTETISSLPQFDAVFVPMLGFDDSLSRLGYGAGYYDKFLAIQPEAQKIGLCFELGRIESLLVEPHDIPMDRIITEIS